MDETEPLDPLGQMIAAARQGDHEAAQALINEFCETVRQNRESPRDERGRPTFRGELWARPLVRVIGNEPYHHTTFDERLLDYFAECFERIGVSEAKRSSQVSADHALNLASNQRGRKRSAATQQKQMDNGYAIHEAYKAATGEKWPPVLNKRAETGPLWEAIRAVAEKRHISKDTAARDYEQWQQLFKRGKPNGKGT
ncbi:hypothetical protein WL38_25840 [Burkholderia ubonensis]|uniref:hypothetical protein n=1 Tax=Burkholderia ubonensis TaxID=101571 RepID=UPI000752600C|nr:hypothetical protein [Burkholderia ubonensis]KWB61267.1 hypothetical protein WL38_25840 [Burkholderia ubonensis]